MWHVAVDGSPLVGAEPALTATVSGPESGSQWMVTTHAASACGRFAEPPIASRMLRAMAHLTRRFHLPSAVRPSSVRIAPDAARTLVTDGAHLIDVRRQDDDTAKLEGALRITPDAIPEWIADVQRDVPIVLACT
jgi:hypothetical protein